MAALRSDEQIARLRQSAYIQDANAWPEYTDQKLFDELNDKLRSVFPAIFVPCRGGYWLKEQSFACTPGRQRNRMPTRAVASILEKVEIADVGSQYFRRLTQLPIAQAQEYDGGTALTGKPQYYYIQGDQICLIPTPDQAYPVNVHFYIRPSLLVTSQSTPGGTDRGRVTNVNTLTRQVTVNQVPNDYALGGAGVAITSASTLIDIVHPNGSCELAMYSQPQTLAGSVFTIGGTDDMSDIQVGDYVRAVEQTDWAPIPEDFQRCLADRAAMQVLMEIGADDKAATLGASVQADMARLTDLVNPRVKADPPRLPGFRLTGQGAKPWLWRS